jgi:hypothetical protein
MGLPSQSMPAEHGTEKQHKKLEGTKTGIPFFVPSSLDKIDGRGDRIRTCLERTNLLQ